MDRFNKTARAVASIVRGNSAAERPAARVSPWTFADHGPEPSGRRALRLAIAEGRGVPLRRALGAHLQGGPRMGAQRQQVRGAFGGALRGGFERTPAQGASGSARTAQRQADPASDPVLLAQYNFLLNSATFAKLDRRITANGTKPILLADGSLGQNIDYTASTHTIRVPVTSDPAAAPPPVVPHPLDQVRGDILWEMHNALNKGALARAATRLNSPAREGTPSERAKEPLYKSANLALSYEWIEWAKTLEHMVRARAINQELPVGGAPAANPPVQDQFGAHYAVVGAGWYGFENYLSDVITWHTTGYDANANTPGWKGHRVLAVAKERTTAPLWITPAQESEFRTGKRMQIKDEALNPFRADALWQEAMSRDP